MAELICFNEACRARYAITDILYNCTKCGGLLEAAYGRIDAAPLKRVFRERRMSNEPLDASGVWRYRELLPFLDDYSSRRDAAGREYSAAGRADRREIWRP